MENSHFSERSPGELVVIDRERKINAFRPFPLPRGRPLEPSLGRKIGQARDALGRLSTAMEQLPESELFIAPFRADEAVLSSKIEGTITTIEDALFNKVSGAGLETDNDAMSVRNYEKTLELGIESTRAGAPLNLTLITQLHAQLLKDDPDVREDQKGRFRSTQVVIGNMRAERDIALAKFIPPPAHFVDECVRELFDYATHDDQDESLVRVAMFHYQFETIHPFADGNGRLGRLLIPLQLAVENVVSRPWVYLSSEIERRKDEYKALLYKVSTEGDFHSWLMFFMEVVIEAARRMHAKLDTLTALRHELLRRVKGYKGDALVRIVPLLFKWPAFTIPIMANELGVSNQSMRYPILELQSRGIVKVADEPLKAKRGRPADIYYCDEVITVFRGGASTVSTRTAE